MILLQDSVDTLNARTATKANAVKKVRIRDVCPSVKRLVCLNLLTLRDRSFLFGMYVPFDKTFPMIP